MKFQTTPSTEHAPVHAGPGEELQRKRSSHVRRACVAALAQAFLSQTLQVVLRCFCGMPSATILAKRALVRLLLSLATAYRVRVNVSRESEDKAVLTAYKRVALKVHPDKGGRTQDFQKLQDAKDKWDALRAQPDPGGRPETTPTGLATAEGLSLIHI